MDCICDCMDANLLLNPMLIGTIIKGGSVMKKIALMLLLLCFAFSICACSDFLDGNTQNAGDYGSDGAGDRPLLTIESLDEYKKVLKTNELPSDFVTHEQIKSMGAFSSMVFLSNADGNDYGKDYSGYMYNLVDESGYEYVLYVHHNASIDASVLPERITEANLQDLRRLDEKCSGTYYQDGLAYRYLSGKLTSIEWEHQGIHFTLSGLSDYPATNSTFIGQLLCGKKGSAELGSIFNTEEK